MSEVDELLLSAYLDGEVTEAERAFVQARLAQDPVWQAALTELMLVFDELDAIEELTLSHDLAPTILAELPQAPQTSWLTSLLLLLQLLGAAVGLVALWPAVQQLAATAETPAFNLPTLELTQLQASLFAWWQRLLSQQIQPPTVELADWSLASVWAQWQTAVPTLSLTSAQWGILLGVAFAVWLIGNGLLFRRDDWSIG